VVETYTDKHKALAKHLTYLEIDDIDSGDDVLFDAYHTHYWVMDKEEAMDLVYDEVDEMIYSHLYTFPIQRVANILKVDVEAIKEFFLADVLVGEVRIGDMLDGELLGEFIDSNKCAYDADYFVSFYTDYLFDYNLSGEIVDSKCQNIMVDGFYIYER
jgi:hypothetical protein